jgi:branched-chain amino acid transport system substrate-binding protein
MRRRVRWPRRQRFVHAQLVDDYGKGHNQYFSEALAKKGGKILGTFGVTADQQDFTAELTQIKALNPEVIYFGGLTPIGVRIRAQMDKLGIKAVFDGTSGIVSDAFIQGLGPLAEGVLAFREGAPTEKLPGGKFFLENYKEAWSGRGRMASWLKSKQDGGENIEKYLV